MSHVNAVAPPSLDQMLLSLYAGKDTHPRDPDSCIRLEFNTPHAESGHLPALYRQRIRAFVTFLEDFFLVPMNVVGIERGCVRVFVRPAGINPKMKKQLSSSVLPAYFHEAMAKCEIDLVYVFGQRMTLTRRRR